MLIALAGIITCWYEILRGSTWNAEVGMFGIDQSWDWMAVWQQRNET